MHSNTLDITGKRHFLKRRPQKPKLLNTWLGRDRAFTFYKWLAFGFTLAFKLIAVPCSFLWLTVCEIIAEE